jgi:hypothetical protein
VRTRFQSDEDYRLGARVDDRPRLAVDVVVQVSEARGLSKGGARHHDLLVEVIEEIVKASVVQLQGLVL